MKLLNDITPIEEDFGKWYTDVVVKGNMIEYGDLQGSIIFKPISYGIWENIRNYFDSIIKEKINSQNVQLPMLIPISLLQKEKQHIKGFAPELATITMIGNKKLNDPIIIRPTSEVLFTKLFGKIGKSYNDLPIIYNQWVNVLRWEKKTSPFLRNREFLWQEGHTVHSNELEAKKLTKKVIKIYSKFLKEYLAIPVIIGKKTSFEKFSGAVETYTVEAMMKDGKALQSGTSHYLGQNFSKAYNSQFRNIKNKKEYFYQTSWGISTRLIGAIIMSHGDNRGIIIPPKIAPYQIDILTFFGNKNPKVLEIAKKIKNKLKRKFRVRLNISNKSKGYKSAESEIEGVPLRIEIGPKDIKNNSIIFARRDNLKKIETKIENINFIAQKLLNEIQKNLFDSANERLNENIVFSYTYEEMKKNIKMKKFVVVPFIGGEKEEKKIKEETGASTRCIWNEESKEEKKCIFTKMKTKRLVVFAKSY